MARSAALLDWLWVMPLPGPVLVTGASGFLGRHVVVELLQAGYHVRASVRSRNAAESLKNLLGRIVTPEVVASRLAFVQLDLLSDLSWPAACHGASAIIHTAAVVFGLPPKEDAAYFGPAVGGTKRVLRHACAAGIRKVVITSSDTVMSGAMPMASRVLVSETDWADADTPGIDAYVRSKILAERAAWSFAAQHSDLSLTAILPSLITGPAIGAHFSSAGPVIERLLSGRDPMLPRLSFAIVDVRDVARLHRLALSDPEFANIRIAAVAGELWTWEIADVLRSEFPGQRISRILAPDWTIRLMALVDRPLRYFVPALGRQVIVDKTLFHRLLGRDPISPEQAVIATAHALQVAGRARLRSHGGG